MTEQLQAEKEGTKRDGVRETKEHSVQKMSDRGKQKRRYQRLWLAECVCAGGSITRQEGADALEVVFAFSI